MDHDYYVPCLPLPALRVLYSFQPVWGYRHQAPRQGLSYLFNGVRKASFDSFLFHTLKFVFVVSRISPLQAFA